MKFQVVWVLDADPSNRDQTIATKTKIAKTIKRMTGKKPRNVKVFKADDSSQMLFYPENEIFTTLHALLAVHKNAVVRETTHD